MGQTLSIDIPPGSATDWETVMSGLRAEGLEVQMRMIDGQIAFPDENPPEDWTELRLAIPDAGMVTLRRTDTGIDVVTWGNADEALISAWQRLANVLQRVLNPNGP